MGIGVWMLCCLTMAGEAVPATARKPAPVVLIGIDGLTFDVIDPLVRAGRLPNMARILADGLRAPLTSEKPMRSPALWTTVATGQPRDVHKIYDFVTDSAYWPKNLRSEKRRLTTSEMRDAPAVWQIAGAANKRSLVVGWLNTWPAEEINGVMFAPFVALDERRQATIKGRIYPDGDGQAHPPELWATVDELIVPSDSVPGKRIAPIMSVPAQNSRLYRQIPLLNRYVYATRWSIAATLTNTRLVERSIATQPRFDLIMTYFDGADTLSHRYWIFRRDLAAIRERLAAQGLNPNLAPELKKRFGRAVDGYYQLADDMVGRIRRAAGSRATVIIISDHGWGSSKGPKARLDSVPFDGEHRMEGVFLARGPRIRPGKLPSLTLYEIAPTLLYLMGLEVPERMPGRVVTEMIKKRALSEQPPGRSNASLPAAPSTAGRVRDAPHTDVELERLRSLGYVD